MALQGFPSTFKLVRFDTKQPAAYQHLLGGNAVPPTVSAVIAQRAVTVLNGFSFVAVK